VTNDFNLNMTPDYVSTYACQIEESCAY